jgi:outer membrane murein-binding lipoprotein Lpp
MGYLYDEIAPERKRELQAHLAHCGDCGKQLRQWRAGALALDEWKLPALQKVPPLRQPMTLLQWAAAAAVVLMAGVAIGRQTSNAAGEVAVLKASVAQLAQKIEAERATTSQQTLRLLADYAQLEEARRSEDRQTIGLALREMDSRLVKLRTELETVAVNTETGFRQTKEGLTTLASYTVADRGDASALPRLENKNQ